MDAARAKLTTIEMVAKIGMGSLGIIMPVLLAASLWVGNTLWALNTQVATLTAQVAQIKSVYSQDDARRDLYARDQKDREHDQRLAEDRAAINENRGRITILEAGRGPTHGGRL